MAKATKISSERGVVVRLADDFAVQILIVDPIRDATRAHVSNAQHSSYATDVGRRDVWFGNSGRSAR